MSSQLVEPELLPGDVCAARQSEYNTSYATKAENSNINHAIVNFAASMEQRTKTAAQTKTSMLSKMVNAITKTIPYPLVMTATYLLGHGDSWCPMRCARHDFALFQRQLLQHDDAYADQLADHTLATVRGGDNSSSDGNTDDEAGEACGSSDSGSDVADDGQDPTERQVKAIDDAVLYKHRHAALDEWSPFELTMGFTCGPVGTADSKLYELDQKLRTSVPYAHIPRLDRTKTPVIAIPQPIREHPKRPAADAPDATKEEYASWALGNFYSDRWMSKLDPCDSDATADRYDDEDLIGHTSLWSKFRRWERRKPREDKDLFAFRCIHNIELRLEARALMREDSKKARLLQRQLIDTSEEPFSEHNADHRESMVSGNDGRGDR